MNNPRKGAEEARKQHPDLLDACEYSVATLVTRRRRPVAVLAPVNDRAGLGVQASLLPVLGSG